MTKQPKPRLTAVAAYENAHLVAQDLLQHISELLSNMPAPDQAEPPIHWGHVGNVTYVNEQLNQIIAFLEPR